MKNLVCGLVLACLASGCASGRMADLRDCGRISVGIGLGLDATAKLGCLIHPSLGVMSNTYRVGLEDRYNIGTWQDHQIVWPLDILYQRMDSPYGLPRTPLASYTYERNPHVTRTDQSDPRCDTSWFPLWQACRGRPGDAVPFHEFTDLEVGATVAVVSVKVGINPLEILDFLLGCAGLDVSHDDPKPGGRLARPLALQNL